jgi:hypothetical protein
MRIFAALAAVFFIAGCGTLATGGGKTQNVRFNSYPSGADVSVDGNGIGKTPTSANLFDMAGYPSRIVLLKHGPNLSMLGNFIFPGPPGFLVDAMSGAGKGELKPSVVNVTMEPARTTDSAEPATAP